MFPSPRLTFARAQHHIDDFRGIIDAFGGTSEDRPWTYFVDKESEPGKDIHKIKFTRQLPDILPCILFDAANNLRAVLDQVGYASAIAWGKRPDPKSTNFPFGPDLAALNLNIERRGVCDHLPPEIVALFRSFQPHEGGNAALWALNKLCNTKKHCALIPLVIKGANANFNARLPPDATVGLGFSPEHVGTFQGWNPTKQEITLATVRAGFDPHIRGDVAFSVGIEGIEALRAPPAISALDEMRDTVAEVLWRTEAECRRLFPTAFA
jgi:hypothetical protein